MRRGDTQVSTSHRVSFSVLGEEGRHTSLHFSQGFLFCLYILYPQVFSQKRDFGHTGFPHRTSPQKEEYGHTGLQHMPSPQKEEYLATHALLHKRRNMPHRLATQAGNTCPSPQKEEYLIRVFCGFLAASLGLYRSLSRLTQGQGFDADMLLKSI